MVISFCGHGKLKNGQEVKEKLYRHIKFYANKGNLTILCGGTGDFDCLVAECVREIKEEHELPKVTAVLVVPFFNSVHYRKFADMFDAAIFFPQKNLTSKNAVLRSMYAMAENSDILIVYVENTQNSNSYKVYNHAKQRSIATINIFFELNGNNQTQ